MGVFDIPASDLIEEIAKDLAGEFKVEKPAFTEYVKTSSHKERAPQRDDWYYVRAASILYRIFKEGPLGVGSLRTYYGGKKNRGVRPHRFRKASGKVIRQAMQSLENAGLIKKADKGRAISPKGHSYLVKKSKAVEALLSGKRVALAKKKAEEAERGEKERLAELKKQEQEEQAKRKKGRKGKEKPAEKPAEGEKK